MGKKKMRGKSESFNYVARQRTMKTEKMRKMNNFNSLASKQGHKGQAGAVKGSTQRSDKQME